MLPKGLLKEYSRALSMMIRFLDVIMIILAGWLAYVMRFNELSLPSSYLSALLIAIPMTLAVFPFFNIYVSVRGTHFFTHMMSLLQAVLVMGLMLSGLSFFTKSGDAFSRMWFVTWIVIALSLLILSRCCILFLLRFMRTRGLNERHVVVMGAGELGIKLAGTIQQALWTGFRVVTFIDDHAENKPAQINGIPVLQTPTNLSQYLSSEGVTEIWLALPFRNEARVKDILYELRHHTITTRFVLDIFGLDLLSHSVTEIAGFPVLNIRSTPMIGINRFVKAVEDRIVAALILIGVSPLFLLLALGVKLSSKGPVFFKQYRHGWDGRIIKIYKFRTMVEHKAEDGWVQQATLDDRRVTKFGKFLRRTSLDELPQFINVLQGRMSIVGPRPHAVQHNEFYKNTIHTYMQRHRVKPGITGWAQINGWRGETDTLFKMQKRVEYDLYYINNWSLGFDLKIIFLTLYRGFISRNAY